MFQKSTVPAPGHHRKAMSLLPTPEVNGTEPEANGNEPELNGTEPEVNGTKTLSRPVELVAGSTISKYQQH